MKRLKKEHEEGLFPTETTAVKSEPVRVQRVEGAQPRAAENGRADALTSTMQALGLDEEAARALLAQLEPGEGDRPPDAGAQSETRSK